MVGNTKAFAKGLISAAISLERTFDTAGLTAAMSRKPAIAASRAQSAT
ncbi:hypothetical protein SAMN05421665_3120 [Yoonia rosea]|uniref:Uncharacterized protein n=1 Tax=Yoonia rosea TaxID=287098 RepID=A0A1R3XGH3_9RHOB|nr:hypothetical protein SAMN05421665_3120 [Yoonia rosea]